MKKISIGIDISKKKCDYCVLDRNGKVVERGQYSNTIRDAGQTAQEMARKYGGQKGECRAVCESTANMWRSTYEAFEDAGIGIQLANPYKLALITKSAKKTDREDAYKLANLLRLGMISACHVPTRHIRGIRTMVRHHVRLTQDRTKVINRIRSMLDAYNVSIEAANLYSRKGIRRLEQTELGTASETFVLQKHVMQMQYLTESRADTDRRLIAEAGQNKDAILLMSMPGVGPFVALLLAAEIDGITRFGGPKKLVSMAGLCPKISESGDVSRMNRIKKQDTNSLVNWAMCEAAQIARMHDPKMALVYESVKRRHAGKHALGIVAVAHKMITIMWHILHTQTPYKSRNEAMYQRKLNKIKRATRKRQ